MSDPAHKETDRLLKEMEKKIAKEYKQAEAEVAEKLADYLRRFKKKDETWQKWVKTGEKTAQDYKKWRMGQMAIGERWEELRNSLANNYHNANKIAKSVIKGYMPDVYAVNHNYSTYEVEHQSMIDTSYTLYDHQSVERILRDNPEMLPPPGEKLSQSIAEGKDIRWNNKQIQSVMMQSIIQGESIGKIADRLSEAVGESNRKAAIRNARTMTTGAENAGRVDGYKRAGRMGIKMKKQWLAILDNRTRHEHRQLDGQIVEVDEPFKVDDEEIMFPGDPTAPAHLIWNCRCTLIGALDRFNNDISYRRNPELGKMTYEEWKKEKKSESRPIDQIDEAERKMKGAYISEYKNGGKVFDYGNKDGIIDTRNIVDRNMSNGLRTSPLHILSDDEIEIVKKDAEDIGVPLGVLKFNEGNRTGFNDFDEFIYIRGDILPDNSSSNLRDNLTERAVLAHEYYGHYKNHPSNFRVGDWRDEFRASYRAAIDTPNLTDMERRSLMLDAYDRAKEAGVTVKYNVYARALIYGNDIE